MKTLLLVKIEASDTTNKFLRNYVESCINGAERGEYYAEVYVLKELPDGNYKEVDS